MRNLTLAALAALALAVLTGCNPANQNEGSAQNGASGTPGKADVNAPIPSTVSGTVTLRDPVTIGEGARLDVKLVDVAEPGVPIAEKTFDVSGAPPFNFSLDLDPSRIDRKRALLAREAQA